ncbi:LysR family transcriptional regulator [Haloactinomyces albus]|uniref:DNA-binding transcriptional LysR family regulator n=1 Tax=Haloactinomyces albus TaxID=1352928 RepID=A0AAE3ZG84_9ACTN|nr:LysR family transcriptional regulator [Haloactinomyces albus]MDR7304356.1 DNA-binding transcriptional LysR family regulator [Haloactinomyces albus]
MAPLNTPPAFTMRQLSTFVAVAETGTISGAAERLFVSQSAVSLAITELEKALRSQLCVRRRAHGVQLTPTGEAALVRARAILHQSFELESDITGTRGELTGRISVGCYPTIGPTILPMLLYEFTTDHPGVSMEFHEQTLDQLVRGLQRGELDTVIVYDLDLPEEWHTAVLTRRSPTILLPADHPRAHSSEPLDLTAMASEPMVLLDTSPSSNHAMQMCGRAGFTPRISYRTSNFETVRALVGRGLGWTLMLQQPRTWVTYEGFEVVSRRIDAPVLDPVSLVIAWQQEAMLSRVAREFIRFATTRTQEHEDGELRK